MKPTVTVNCAIIFIFAVVLELVTSAPHNYENLPVNKKSDNERVSSQLWFGPRLGRKKRNPGDEPFRADGEQKEQVGNLLEILQDTPWAIVAVSDGKRHVSTFTPRLGRESDEDFMSNDRTSDFELSERSPFAPRLGRRFSPFSPRLGRYTEKL